MKEQEFHVDYFDKEYLDSQFPNRKNIPQFQLSRGDSLTDSYSCHYVISKPKNFLALALDVLQHLKKPTSLRHTYQSKCSESALAQIGETGKKVLEEICNLHNEFVTPKRS